MNPVAPGIVIPTTVRPEFESAAAAGDVFALETMLNAGADVDAKDRYGQSALMLAAHRGHLVAVEALLRHGANLNVTAKYGLSALMLSIVAGHEAVARALVRAGADLGLRGSGAPGFLDKTAYDLAEERRLMTLCAEIAKAKESRT
ncbi:MAG: ankyrin repeat domain-containing protein [Betaproteobacteria bacterium]|nr:ankyrin repeat domain-containing protein [Betaproteobacteria bacterium]MDH4323081.1 ankyrin repeat domain-containing protein [Betaproteobacteria bacterium]MDH5211351.1 ankyrin repeat domain-containing protein [Betaproteobacteria bacterium]MDH5577141.1 ankyrin repeat domain-containing protein [Betaproteobacteria bacterium]